MRTMIADTGVLTGSASMAGLLTLYWIRHLSRQLQASTSLIGYPVHADFDINYYLSAYHLVVVGFPLMTLALFGALSWIGRRAGLYDQGLPELPAASEATIPDYAARSYRWLPLRHLASTSLVGAVLGTEAVIYRNTIGDRYWLAAAGGGVVYSAAIVTAALAAHGRRRGPVLRTMSAFNAIGTVATVLGLAGAARVTAVTVAADGAVHRYNWFRLSVAVPVTVGILLVVLISLWRAGTHNERTRNVERWSLILVALPVLIFLAYAQLPGDAPGFSYFEDGQLVATANFLRHGELPYSDFFATHGVLSDTFQPLVGMTALVDSYWGELAGRSLIVGPLAVILLFILVSGLSGRSWPLLLAAAVMFLHAGPLVIPYVRFMFWPLILILLKLTVSRRQPAWAVATGAATVMQAIVTPEAAYFIPAIGLAIVGRDLYHRHLGWRLASLQLTSAVVVGGAAVLAALMVFLFATRSIEGFLQYYQVVAVDHSLQGGIPLLIDLNLPITRFEVVAPVAAGLFVMFWIGTRLRWRLPITDVDWVMVAAAVLSLVYYEKFLGRADQPHLDESYAAAMPLLVTIAVRTVRSLDGVWHRSVAERDPFGWVKVPASLVALVAALMVTHDSLLASLPQVAHQYRSAAAVEPQEARVGYVTPGRLDYASLADVRAFLGVYLRPGDRVFDFTNQPALYHYLLDYSQVPPNYQVSTTMLESAQEDLVAQIRRDHPLFVIWFSLNNGLPMWDNVYNMVRHYTVSRYVLDNYRPFAMVGGQALYVLKSAAVPSPESVRVPLHHPPITSGLEFLPDNKCDWGYAPDFLSVRPAGDSIRMAVPLAQRSGASSTVMVEAPRNRTWSDFHWLEVQFGHRPSRDAFTISDSSVPGHEITFRVTGRGPGTIWIPVGSCAQWHGYGAAPLKIAELNGQQAVWRLAVAP
jgi:hypothetical protein